MFIALLQASEVATASVHGASISPQQVASPPELEQTLQMLSSHRTVLGVLVLSRASPPQIIRHSGVVFDGENGRKYAKAVGRIVEACKVGLEEIDGETVSPMCLAISIFRCLRVCFRSRMISNSCVFELEDTSL